MGMISRIRDNAIQSLATFLEGVCKGRRLIENEVVSYQNHKFVGGWRIRVDFSDGPRELDVLLQPNYPFCAPRVAIVDGPGVLVWPHLERDNVLCVWPSESGVSLHEPVEVAKCLLSDVCKLIEKCVNEDHLQDFRDEFLSYWGYAVHTDAPELTSLLEPTGPTRVVKVWHGRKKRVFADSEDKIRRWLERSRLVRSNSERNFKNAILIWMSEPLTPDQYPKRASDLLSVARRNSKEATGFIETLISDGSGEIDVLLGAPTPNGACFACIIVYSARLPKRPRQQAGNALTKGFRPGLVPKDILLTRYLGAGSGIKLAKVERADHTWVHGRDHDQTQQASRSAKVAILGCGSLGSPVARLLAQSGIGKFLLVDRELLDRPNTSRHVLGAGRVGHYKAQELANKINSDFPHLGGAVAETEEIGFGNIALQERLSDCDIIVSAMGNWVAEGFLNIWQQSIPGRPPIIYGWVEPHAIVGHALAIFSGTPCLNCGFFPNGIPKSRVTNWPKGTDYRQEPACGAIFAPYGAIEMSAACTLVAELVLDILQKRVLESKHRIWIGQQYRLEVAGGRWDRNWCDSVGDPGKGGVRITRAWSVSESCPICNKAEPG